MDREFSILDTFPDPAGSTFISAMRFNEEADELTRDLHTACADFCRRAASFGDAIIRLFDDPRHKFFQQEREMSVRDFDIDDMRKEFNRASGTVRIVALFSPT